MKISVFVIIQQNDRFLLIRESNPKWKNKWFLPGGKLEENETFVDAAIRESKEETGYDVAISGLTLVRLHTKAESRKGLRIYLSGRVIGGDKKVLVDEHSLEAEWFTMEEMKSLEFRENISDLLLKHILEQGAVPTTTLAITG